MRPRENVGTTSRRSIDLHEPTPDEGTSGETALVDSRSRWLLPARPSATWTKSPTCLGKVSRQSCAVAARFGEPRDIQCHLTPFPTVVVNRASRSSCLPLRSARRSLSRHPRTGRRTPNGARNDSGCSTRSQFSCLLPASPVLRGIDIIVPSIPQHWRPEAIHAFMSSPQRELVIDDTPCTPVQWLLDGRDPRRIAEILMTSRGAS